MFREWNNRYEGSCYKKQPNIICLKNKRAGPYRRNWQADTVPAQARRLSENQHIDVLRVEGSPKYIRSPHEIEGFDTGGDDQANPVTADPRDEHERTDNRENKQSQAYTVCGYRLQSSFAVGAGNPQTEICHSTLHRRSYPCHLGRGVYCAKSVSQKRGRESLAGRLVFYTMYKGEEKGGREQR